MSEISRDLETGQIEFGELLSRLTITVPGAALLGGATVEIVQGYDSHSDSVSQQFSDPLPTVTGTEAGANANHAGSEISTGGAIGLITGPMILAALATTLWMKWQNRTR